jgi:hypothetical protein
MKENTVSISENQIVTIPNQRKADEEDEDDEDEDDEEKVLNKES